MRIECKVYENCDHKTVSSELMKGEKAIMGEILWEIQNSF